MDSTLFKSKFVRWAVCCLLVCCCLVDAASGATKKKPKKKSSSSTSASKSKSSKSDESSSNTAATSGGVLSVTGPIQSGSTLVINSNANAYQGVTIAPAAAGTLNISNNSSSGSLSVSNVSLTKAGTGTLTLSGINSYTGSTTVTNGILINSSALLNAGSLTSSGTMNVNSTGLLNTISLSGGLTADSISFANTNANFNFSPVNNVNLGTGTLVLNAAGNPFALSGSNSYTAPPRVLTPAGYLVINGGELTNGGVINNTGTLTIPSNLVTTQYFATQNSKPVGYQQTLGHYVQISNLATTPSSLTLSPVATVIGPARPGALAASAGSLASALGLSTTNQGAINTSGLVKIGAGTATLDSLNPASSGYATVTTGGTLRFNVNTSSSGANFLTLASPQISTVPEPSTLVLAAFGLAGLGALRLRRRCHSPSSAV